MSSVLSSLIVFCVWVTGCVFFDGYLQLTGSWLMLAGVVTFWVAMFAAGIAKVNL